MATFPFNLSTLQWRLPNGVRTASEYFMQKVIADYPGAAEWMDSDALGYVHSRGDVQVKVARELGGKCSVHGVYDNRKTPPLILIESQATFQRTNFTVLHELGHHLQQTDSDWLYEILNSMSWNERWRLEERVSDSFAASCLLPENLVAEAEASYKSNGAAAARELFWLSSASRAACCARIIGRRDSAALILTDMGGTVLFGGSAGDVFAPQRGTEQADVSRILERASNSTDSDTLRGQTIEGLRYGSGKTLGGLQFDVAPDGDGYAFVLVTKLDELAREQWDEQESQCSECMQSYPDADIERYCKRCNSRKCPKCNACSCGASVTICDMCYTALSAIEMSRNLHRHVECP